MTSKFILLHQEAVSFRSKQQRVTHLLNMGIAEPTVTKMLALLEREGSVEHLTGVLKQMTKRKNPATNDIKQGEPTLKGTFWICFYQELISVEINSFTTGKIVSVNQTGLTKDYLIKNSAFKIV